MGKAAKRTRGAAWVQPSGLDRRLQYAVLTGEEAHLTGAQILCFHPRTQDALFWMWPDGRVGFSAVHFSKADAEECLEDVVEMRRRSK